MSYLERYSLEKKRINNKYKNRKDVLKFIENSWRGLEKRMFHSTGGFSPEYILSKKLSLNIHNLESEEGMDRRWSNDESFFGNGLYFADFADYSHFNSNGLFAHIVSKEKYEQLNYTYDMKEDPREYKMIMAKVLTGLSWKGAKGMTDTKGHPKFFDNPNENGIAGKSLKWDSLTDDYPGGPIMNVVFENWKVLPEYLITYKCITFVPPPIAKGASVNIKDKNAQLNRLKFIFNRKI